MLRRFATSGFLFLLLGASLPAQSPPPPVIDFERSSVDLATGEAVFEHAKLSDGNAVLTADAIRYNTKTDVATAIGHVTLTRGPQRIITDKLVYRRTDGNFSAGLLRVGSYPFYVSGASAAGTLSELTVQSAIVTYREPGPWQPTVNAGSITYAPNQRIRATAPRLGLGSAQPVPLLHFQQNLNEPLISYLTFNGGFRKSLGAYGEAGLRIPLRAGVKVGGDVAFYTARGLMAGPSATYLGPDEGRDLRGFFRSGFINDHGEKLTDILNRPISSNRGYVEWQHQQTLAENLTLSGTLNWWKDSEIVRDFHPKYFFPVQEPDTFLESVYTGHNYFVSLFARFQPNAFHPVQERLPEVRFDLLPLAVGHGFYEQFNASAVALRDRPPVPFGTAPQPRLESDRLDAYYALTRPFTPSEWLNFTPLAGARVTHYSGTTGAKERGDYTRVLGELGFDSALRASATYDYKNPQWKIDGLRHLVTPKLTYRYIPQGDIGRRFIPQIDRREPITSYLRPLGLGDQRNLDDLRATNTLRLGLDNTIQTRDATYGSRDLLVLNIAADFRFHRELGERDLSAIYSEFALMPAPWLQIDYYNSFTPQTGTLQEFNASITIHDGTAWSVRFSNNFLRRQTEDYRVEGRAHLNEAYDVLARFQYDARTRRLNEQAYGLVQNLNNTWLIEYVVSVRSGSRRENGFGFNIQIETRNF